MKAVVFDLARAIQTPKYGQIRTESRLFRAPSRRCKVNLVPGGLSLLRERSLGNARRTLKIRYVNAEFRDRYDT